jgi:hypothetical protein
LCIMCFLWHGLCMLNLDRWHIGIWYDVALRLIKLVITDIPITQTGGFLDSARLSILLQKSY